MKRRRLLNRPRSVSFIFVDVERAAEAEAVRAAIAGRFPDVQASLSSEFAQDSDQMAQFEAISNAISLLALLVAGIVVANTMFMSIYERTREIGTLRAVGWGSRRILGQVLQESLLLCLVAGVLGSILGVVMLWGLASRPRRRRLHQDGLGCACHGPRDRALPAGRAPGRSLPCLAGRPSAARGGIAL